MAIVHLIRTEVSVLSERTQNDGCNSSTQNYHTTEEKGRKKKKKGRLIQVTIPSQAQEIESKKRAKQKRSVCMYEDLESLYESGGLQGIVVESSTISMAGMSGVTGPIRLKGHGCQSWFPVQSGRLAQ